MCDTTTFETNIRQTLNKRSLNETCTEDMTKSTTDVADLKNQNEQLETKTWRNGLVANNNEESDKSTAATNVDGCTPQIISDIIDSVIRILLAIIFIKLEVTTAFKREIHEEELWLYKNPRRDNIVSTSELLITVVFAPFIITLVYYICTKNKSDFKAASWSWTLALCMNSLPTSLLKITVGRPRPDFFYRCFPDGNMILDNSTMIGGLQLNCSGDLSVVNEGRKSFPSGHASFAFASFGFISLYLGGKLHTFNTAGRGQTWRLSIFVAPLLLAALVSISRTCDYHHHWQDVLVGALIGWTSGYISYRQYYPTLYAHDCQHPYMRWQSFEHAESRTKLAGKIDIDSDSDEHSVGDNEYAPLLH